MLTAILKFFSPLAHPICLIWLVCLVGCVVMWRKKQKAAFGILLGIALFISLIGSRIPLILIGGMESPYTGVDLAKLEPADAVVLLGGGVSYSRTDPLGMNFNEAADRVLVTYDVLRLGKAPVLIMGGGGDDRDGVYISEGAIVREWLEKRLPNKVEVKELGISGSTHDEAVKCAALVKEHGWKRIILVTSGYHMRRAEATFRTAGVPVIPLACDFFRPGMPNKEPFNPLPWPEGFNIFNLYAHEKAGWVVYRSRGWISSEAANKQ